MTDDHPLAPPSAATTAKMRGNKRAGTKPEVRLRSALHAKGLRFRKDFPVRAGGRVRHVDIAFTKRHVAVFLDGCFWHGCPVHGHFPKGQNEEYWRTKILGNRERDAEDERILRLEGWRVLRIWEHEPVEDAVRAVEGVLKEDA